jgi:hypothetical protein
MRTAQQAAQQQAHTGPGSIANEQQDSLSDIDKKKAQGFDPGAAAELTRAAQMKANTQILAAQAEFEKQMGDIGTHADDQQIQGYAKIADEAAKSAKKIQDDWQALAAKVGASSDAGVDEQLAAIARTEDINANMLREMGQLHQRTMEQIGKEEEQTARYSLSEWQQNQLRIVDTYQDRVRQIDDLEKQQDAALDADMKAHTDQVAMDQKAELMASQDANAQRVAAYQQMNAQMQQSDEETRNKLEQGLQSLFEHPEKFFEQRAMDTAFQLMANEMLSTFKSSTPAGGILQYMFGMGPEMSTSANPLTAVGSLFHPGGHSGTAGLSSSLTSGTNPSMMQFQQGSGTLLTASQALLSAAAAQQSAAATMGARGGMGGIGGMGGSGVGGGTFGGAGISTSSTAGSQFGGGGADASNPLAMPGLGGSLAPMSSGTWDNSLMQPGLNGIAAESTINQGGAAAGAASSMGTYAGMAGGALMAGTSIYSAYENSNPVAGAMGGAMGGMELGAAIGSVVPGLGTLVGGAIGALAGGVGGLMAGLFGDKGKGQAEGLDVNTIQPALVADMQAYEQGRSGYDALSTQLNSMLISAQNQTQSWGSGARGYFNDNIRPEINAVLSSLQKQERGGRSQVTLSAAQFHDGGWTGDYGDLATSDTEGFVHTMANEFVVNPMAAASHAPILQAMNSGVNFGYSSSVQPRMPAAPSGGSANITIQAIDSKSVAQWAKAGGGLALMAAMNQANRQYSGVGRG